MARNSKKLATIDRAVPLTIDLGDVVVEPPDRSTMAELFRKLEFRALLKRMDELEDALPGAAPPPAERTATEWREGELADLGRPRRERLAVAPAGEGRFAVAAREAPVLVVAAADRATAGRGSQPP